jgi:hypothetical protein
MEQPAGYGEKNKSQRLWVVRGIALTASCALLALSAPLVWAAVSAGAGLGLLVGMALAGAMLFQAMPLGLQKLENHLLKLRRAEARRNPIEQLQGEMLRRAQRLKSFRQALVTVGGQIESIEQMMAERHQQDPGHVLERQERALQRLRQFHGINLNRLVQAQAALDEFGLTVQRKDSEWRMAMAIDDATAALDPSATENLMQNLLTDTALRTVQDRFNRVFAELDIQMSSAEGPTRSLLDQRNLDHMDELHLPQYASSRSQS